MTELEKLNYINSFKDKQVPFATCNRALVILKTDRTVDVVADIEPEHTVAAYEIPCGTVGKAIDNLVERLLPLLDNRYICTNSEEMYAADENIYDVIDEFWETEMNNIAFVVLPDESCKEYIDGMSEIDFKHAINSKLSTYKGELLYFPGQYADYLKYFENKINE